MPVLHTEPQKNTEHTLCQNTHTQTNKQILITWDSQTKLLTMQQIVYRPDRMQLLSYNKHMNELYSTNESTFQNHLFEADHKPRNVYNKEMLQYGQRVKNYTHLYSPKY